jgi:hypothetical protein
MKKISIALALVACLFASIGLAQNATPAGPMVTYEIKAPDGKTYTIEGPPGASRAQAKQVLLTRSPEAGIVIKKKKIEVELADGRILEFPVGTDLGVVKVTIKRVLAQTAVESKKTGATKYDMSKISTADLEAIAAGNMAGVSDAGQRILAAQDAANQPSQPPTTPTITNTNTTATPSTPPSNTSFNESIAIGLVLGGLLWLAGRWQWRKLSHEPKHAGKAKLEGAKNFLFVTLGVDIVATAIVMACTIWAIGLLKDLSAGNFSADGSLIPKLEFVSSFSWVLVLTTIGVGLGLVKWLNACYLYAKEVVGASEFKNEKWTIAGWIIPIFNLFKPYQIINEIYKCSAPGYTQPDGWKKESWSGPLLTWWIFWAVTHQILGGLYSSRYFKHHLEVIYHPGKSLPRWKAQ